MRGEADLPGPGQPPPSSAIQVTPAPLPPTYNPLKVLRCAVPCGAALCGAVRCCVVLCGVVVCATEARAAEHDRRLPLRRDVVPPQAHEVPQGLQRSHAHTNKRTSTLGTPKNPTRRRSWGVGGTAGNRLRSLAKSPVCPDVNPRQGGRDPIALHQPTAPVSGETVCVWGGGVLARVHATAYDSKRLPRRTDCHVPRVFLKRGGGGSEGCPPPPPSGDPELLEAPNKLFGLNRLAPKAPEKNFDWPKGGAVRGGGGGG